MGQTFEVILIPHLRMKDLLVRAMGNRLRFFVARRRFSERRSLP